MFVIFSSSCSEYNVHVVHHDEEHLRRVLERLQPYLKEYRALWDDFRDFESINTREQKERALREFESRSPLHADIPMFARNVDVAKLTVLEESTLSVLMDK